MHLVTERADDEDLPEILLARRLTHAAITVIGRRDSRHDPPLAPHFRHEPPGARFDFGFAQLPRVDLNYADLNGANLAFAKLHRAKLRSAKLSTEDLRAADLGHADLGHAKLSGANLFAAILVAADLSDADLRGPTNLSSATLTGANLTWRRSIWRTWLADRALRPSASVQNTDRPLPPRPSVLRLSSQTCSTAWL